MPNQLFYGDNLEVMRRHLKDESVDLCYIDPPFNSNRDYFQIYNNIGGEDRAQAQAFTDTWTWDDNAREALNEILTGQDGRFPAQTIELIRGLKAVLKEGALLAYIVSMTMRIVEIHRVLKSTGSFYLHCDPTASHYLKLVLDSVFVTQGGDFKNEITWRRTNNSGSSKSIARRFASNADIIFYYVKSKDYFFKQPRANYGDDYLSRFTKLDERGYYYLDNLKTYSKERLALLIKEDRVEFTNSGKPRIKNYLHELKGMILDNVWVDINPLNSQAAERLGYPTQKPEALLERIISASSNPGDVVLDAYCGCGTTIAVAQKLDRAWIGIDITYQSIGVILKRLIDSYGKEIGESVVLNGIPRDMASARALALKKDDRVRKEFEKWAVLTFSRHQAIINTKKGADGGVDGLQFFPVAFGSDETGKVLYQVKSGNVGRKDISQLRGDMLRENTQLGVFISLEEPTAPMKIEAASAGTFDWPLMHKKLPVISLVTIREMIENKAVMELPLSHTVNKRAVAQSGPDTQIALDLGEN